MTFTEAFESESAEAIQERKWIINQIQLSLKTPEGALQFAAWLWILGYFDRAETDGERARRNGACDFLEAFGLGSEAQKFARGLQIAQESIE